MIDSVLFAYDLPAGTYASGDTFSLSAIRGASVVRDGYGTAKLKRMVAISTASAISLGSRVTFKNANWNDSITSMLASAQGNNALTILTDVSPAVQRCGNIEMQPNSGFEVKLTIGEAVTTSVDTTVFCLIDIDYPSVAAVANPANEEGQPVTIMRNDTITSVAHGTAVSSLVWTTVNVDEFKAGYKYLLAVIGCTDNNSDIGFVAFSGAASMQGLVRIIPVMMKTTSAGRNVLQYSTPLVKGPMNIEYAAVGTTAGSYTAYLECDYIRR